MSSTGDTPISIVLTTLGADADAAGLAQILVEERLAACVNVIPIRSIYRWRGQIERDGEQQLIIKTASDRVAALEARLRELHPYELPELLVIATSGSEAYIKWVRESVGPVQPNPER